MTTWKCWTKYTFAIIAQSSFNTYISNSNWKRTTLITAHKLIHFNFKIDVIRYFINLPEASQLSFHTKWHDLITGYYKSKLNILITMALSNVLLNMLIALWNMIQAYGRLPHANSHFLTCPVNKYWFCLIFAILLQYFRKNYLRCLYVSLQTMLLRIW